MSKIIAVVEGQTEQTFVRDVLAPWIATHSRLQLVASIAGKPGRKGGCRYAPARRDILGFVRQGHYDVVTTMFDFYGMPDTWPGRDAARSASYEQKALTVENAVLSDITQEFGDAFDGRMFVPYVQMYEFEALLFSQPSAWCKAIGEPDIEDDLIRIVSSFGSPEEINDNPDTSPSHRIEQFFRNAKYRKPLHGALAAKKIGIDVIQGECPHFSEWIQALQRHCSDLN